MRCPFRFPARSVSWSLGRATAGAAILLGWLIGPAGAGAQMPNAAQMSGVPLPAPELPNGTLTVRVVRGEVTDNVAGQPVELHGGPSVLTATTDAQGRAHFSGLAPGTRVHAVAVVDGRRVTSETFAVPAQGGVRILLVAPAAGAAPPAGSGVAPGAPGAGAASPPPAPPQPGDVSLGRETQFVIELNDDELEVFYLLQIVNPAKDPVEHAPLVFEVPAGARNLTLLEGSSPLASVKGPRLTVTGPFPPGATLVQVAYQLPYHGDQVTIRQPLPVSLEAVAIAAQKVGAMHLSSPQMSNHGEMPAEGKVYLVATGPRVGAGEALSVTLTGLPTRARWPRTLALALAAGVLAAGVWASVAVGDEAGRAAARRRALRDRRDRLFADLVRLEEAHRAGRLEGPGYEARRRELVAELERVYGELDEGLAA
jgi:hypothetical protein